jgi:hypothetical protein
MKSMVQTSKLTFYRSEFIHSRTSVMFDIAVSVKGRYSRTLTRVYIRVT